MCGGGAPKVVQTDPQAEADAAADAAAKAANADAASRKKRKKARPFSPVVQRAQLILAAHCCPLVRRQRSRKTLWGRN